MNKFIISARMILLAVVLVCGGSVHAISKAIHLSKNMDGSEVRCLHDLLAGYLSRNPSEHEIGRLIEEAEGAKVNLRGGELTYVFVLNDMSYCGTAGCMMLIGDLSWRDGKCHLLDEGNGSGNTVTVLARRDNGYRRLLTPCEIYFDGAWYQQVHAECPTAEIHR